MIPVHEGLGPKKLGFFPVKKSYELVGDLYGRKPPQMTGVPLISSPIAPSVKMGRSGSGRQTWFARRSKTSTDLSRSVLVRPPTIKSLENPKPGKSSSVHF